jgi:hypothetical protein
MDTTPRLPSSEDAHEIVRSMLAATGDALMSGEFDLFHVHFTLPYRVETFEGTAQALHLDDLRRLYDGARAYYARGGIGRLLRTCLSVHARDPAHLTATYETLLVPHVGAPTRPPYWCNMDMHLTDGRWRVARRAFAIADDAHHVRALLGAPSSPGADP